MKDQVDTWDLIIKAGKTERHYWKDLWRYRELFFFLSWRDILVRYKQTLIGIAWAVIRPLLTMIVFTFVFGQLAKLPAEGSAYPVMVFAALLPWQLFSTALSESSNSLIINRNLVSKIYFPRIIIPTSAVIVGLVDFLISFALLIGLMFVFNIIPDWKILTLPLFILWTLIVSLGSGFLFSAFNVKYRDVRYIIPFIIQFGLYISPVGFSTSVIPEQWRLLYSLNPMVGIIDGCRWAISGSNVQLYMPGLILSVLFSIFILLIGIVYFRKTEKTFADLI
jgi:lipopolysaccharide transport system permease protein